VRRLLLVLAHDVADWIHILRIDELHNAALGGERDAACYQRRVLGRRNRDDLVPPD
jgi:hypothetical protein